MSNVLVVEDSKFFSGLLKKKIEKKLNIPVTIAETFAEAREILAANKKLFFLALLDLNLPDAQDSEIVEYFHLQDIPSIVFTGSFDENKREDILSMDVIDYVTKDNPSSIDYIVSLVKRIRNNSQLHALVVDDSATARKIIRKFLESYQLNVLEAADGLEALSIIENNRTKEGNKIVLVVTDYHMPNMDGFQLVRALRKDWPKDKIAILGVSSQGSNALSAKFIKNGANDFISKPFLPEEFLCRVSLNIDNIEYLNALQIAATRDYLTGMFNRRFFFEMATPVFASAVRKNTDLMVAMIDIDHFKLVNDTYGHDVGDDVLVAVAKALESTSRETDIIARFGGEEFCLIAPGIAPDDIEDYLEKLRARIANLSLCADEKQIVITVSIGATGIQAKTLDDMITSADVLLFKAKEKGRNTVVTARPE